MKLYYNIINYTFLDTTIFIFWIWTINGFYTHWYLIEILTHATYTNDWYWNIGVNTKVLYFNRYHVPRFYLNEYRD